MQSIEDASAGWPKKMIFVVISDGHSTYIEDVVFCTTPPGVAAAGFHRSWEREIELTVALSTGGHLLCKYARRVVQRISSLNTNQHSSTHNAAGRSKGADWSVKMQDE